MKKKNRLVNLIFILFAVLGIFFAGIGVILISVSVQFKRDAVEVRAVITEIEYYRDSGGDMSHRVYVSYSYDGKQYDDVRISEYSSSMYKGKEITLFIDPQKPYKAQTGLGMILGAAIFILVGGIFTCVGVIPLAVMGKKASEAKKLVRAGHYIYATVESINCNTGYSVNGRHPYVVYCVYRDDYTDITYRFKSDNIWTNPEYVLQPGNEIRVFVNADDYKKYHVDVESIIQGRIADYT